MASIGAEVVVQARGVIADPENPLLSSYRSNVLKDWIRAHPLTAAIHYPELE